MKRFFYSFCLTALLMLVGQSLSAHDFEVGRIYYNYLSETDKTVAVTFKGQYYFDYDNEYSGNVVIPESVSYNGTTYRVMSIGSYAFFNCSGLTSIKIPNSVTSIGSYAFFNCSGLTSIEIPNSVTSIGEDAFYNTGWYNNQPNGLVYAGKVAYKYKGTMPDNTSIILKEGTLGIVDRAFYNCTGLTSIEIPNSVTSIGNYAFYNCTGKLLIHCNIGNANSYDDGWFGKSKFNKVEIGEEVTSIGNFAFNNCTGLTSIDIPNSVTNIGGYAFYGCTGLTSFEIPNSVTNIGGYAFYGCTGLTSIGVNPNNSVYDSRNNCNAIINTSSNTLIAGCKNTIIPNSVTSIGYGAFSGCTGLTNITIPNSVTSIGIYAFYKCI